MMAEEGVFGQKTKIETDYVILKDYDTEEVKKSGENLYKRRRLFPLNHYVGTSYEDSKVFDARWYNYVLSQLINKNNNLTIQVKILACIDPEKWEELLPETDILAQATLPLSCSEPWAFYKAQARIKDYSPIQKAWSYNGNTAVFTDETSDINNATVNDVALPPIQITSVGDAIYFGSDEIFSLIRVTVGTAGVYSGVTLAWQYYNGSWVALSGLSDGTNGFKNAGTNNVTYTLPTDWIKVAVNGVTTYWIRCVVTTLSTPSLTTAPLGTQAWLTGVRALVQAYMSGYNK